MKTPRKAVVLAAGLATRMRPLSLTRPKPLMPLWGIPLLEHTLKRLERWGVHDVLINAAQAAPDLIEFVRCRPRSTLRLTVSYEPEVMGTAGVLSHARWFLDAPLIWMVNADTAWEAAPALLLREQRQRPSLTTLWLCPDAGPRTVEMHDGAITDFASPRAGGPGTYTFTGLHLLRPRILDFIPMGVPSSIIDAYRLAMSRGERLSGIVLPRSFWADLGTPSDYLAAHADVLRRFEQGKPGGALADPDMVRESERLRRTGVHVSGFVAVGQGARIQRGAVVENAVLWEGCTVADRAHVTNAIVARGTHVRGHVEHMAGPASALAVPAVREALLALAWPLERTCLTVLPPRGSARQFTRVRSGRRRALVVAYSLSRPENERYVPHARFLRAAGVRVPAILRHMPHLQTTMIEDLGETHLIDLVSGKRQPTVIARYRQVLDVVAHLHVTGTRRARRCALALCEPFSTPLYEWEHALFDTHVLRGRLALGRTTRRHVRTDLAQLAQRLTPLPNVLLHRDLQSSNIMFQGGTPALIDFQGMRFGPAAYDIASLLCDPYVSLPEDMQTSLAVYYARRVGMDTAAFCATFWYAAVQRLVQAVGAFARLGADPRTAVFEAHVTPGLLMLTRCLSHIDNTCPHLEDVVDHALRGL